MMAGRKLDQPFAFLTFISSLLLIIRKLDFVLARFFIMRIASVTPFVVFKLANEQQFATSRNIEHRVREFSSLKIQGKFVVKTDLIQRLIRGSKSLVDL